MYITCGLLQHHKLQKHNANQMYERSLEMILEISFINVKSVALGHQGSLILFVFPHNRVSECMY